MLLVTSGRRRTRRSPKTATPPRVMGRAGAGGWNSRSVTTLRHWGEHNCVNNQQHHAPRTRSIQYRVCPTSVCGTEELRGSSATTLVVFADLTSSLYASRSTTCGGGASGSPERRGSNSMERTAMLCGALAAKQP